MQAFLQRFLRAAHIATKVEYKCLEALTRYILELSMLDINMLGFRPSTVAAATLLLARILLAHMHSTNAATKQHIVWTRTMEHYAFHTARELEGCARKLHKTLLTASSRENKTTIICHKYKQAKRGAVASLHFLQELPSTAFDRFASFSVPADYFSHLPL
jgi:cyclin-A